MSHTFGDGDYSGCGGISAFFKSLAFASLNLKIESPIVANPANAYLLDLIKTRGKVQGQKYDSQKAFKFDLDTIFNSPELIQPCEIEQAKGNLCVDMRYLLHGLVRQHESYHFFQKSDEAKDMPRYECRHYNVLEHTFICALCVYKDKSEEVYRIGCRVCKTSVMSSNHAGYQTILDAFIDCERVSKVHRFYLPVQHWGMHSEPPDEEKYDSSTSLCFRITDSYCSNDAKKDVVRCHPNHSTPGGCLGWDQFVASSIDNEMAMSEDGPSAMKCVQSAFPDLLLHLHASFTSNRSQYHQLESRFADCVHQPDLIHQKFGGRSLFDDIVVHNLEDGNNLEDGSNTQNDIVTTDKLCQSVLVDTVVNMYVHDYCDEKWLVPAMPDKWDSWSKAHPKLFEGFKSAIEDSNNQIVSFIQTGYFAKFWTEADNQSKYRKKYAKLPPLLIPFAFQYSNGCVNPYDEEGRKQRLTSTTLVVCQSTLNYDESDENLMSLVDYLNKDNSYLVRIVHATKDRKKKPVAVEVDWILSAEIMTRLMIDCRTEMSHLLQFKNEWVAIPEKVKSVMGSHVCGRILQYTAAGFSCVSLNPYVATINARGVTLDQTYGWAWTQAMIDYILHSDSANALRAMELMTNASFQRGIKLQQRVKTDEGGESSAQHSRDVGELNQEVDASNNRKRKKQGRSSYAPTVRVRAEWGKKGGGCLTWRENPPATIDDMPTLPHKVTTEEWNCFNANVKNTFQTISHYDNTIEAFLLSRPTMTELRSGLRDCGYDVFTFIDFEADKLIEFVSSLSLPMVVQIHTTSQNYATYTHVIGVSPFYSNGSMSMMIIDGAHPDCKPMSFDSVNLAWCAGGISSTSRYSGFAFMPNAKRSEEIYLLSVGKPIICLSSKFVRGLDTKKSDFLRCAQGSVVCNFKKRAKRKSRDTFNQLKNEVSEKNIILQKKTNRIST
jgi:hypothetical protein